MAYFITGRDNSEGVKFARYYPNEIDLRIGIKEICESNKDHFKRLLIWGMGNREQVNAVCDVPIDFDDKNLLDVFDKVIQVNRLCIDRYGDQIYHVLRCEDGHVFTFTH